ncbi:MAG: PadR family transcriptional regulator, regulatory protein PadR [Actinomycetota bacterium]|jgi:DNA-binding PadR family transcriptional regulator|nr:PadR family transcriptional regulator, regulatory protein PadR [Actinomycetota bacterium]
MSHDPRGHLDLLLLAVLQPGPAHGYAVIGALRDRSDGTFDLPEGTVYPALHKLERQGLVSSRWTQGDGRRRRVYHLTGYGVAALAARRQEWGRFSSSVQAVLGRPSMVTA